MERIKTHHSHSIQIQNGGEDRCVGCCCCNMAFTGVNYGFKDCHKSGIRFGRAARSP